MNVPEIRGSEGGVSIRDHRTSCFCGMQRPIALVFFAMSMTIFLLSFPPGMPVVVLARSSPPAACPF
jgi:hypothetical protein